MNAAGLDDTTDYTGHNYDESLDKFYAQARFYDATNKQFVSQDVIKDSLNWYVYANNNPTNFIDPTGKANVYAREYAESRGATVQWLRNFTSNNIAYAEANFTYKGVTQKFVGRLVNNNMTIEDTVLDYAFNWGHGYTINNPEPGLQIIVPFDNTPLVHFLYALIGQDGYGKLSTEERYAEANKGIDLYTDNLVSGGMMLTITPVGIPCSPSSSKSGMNNRITPQQMNQYKGEVLSGNDIRFKGIQDALDFIKKKFPNLKQEVSGGRSAEGWHFDSHPINGSSTNIEHINIYSKSKGFRAHITWGK